MQKLLVVLVCGVALGAAFLSAPGFLYHPEVLHSAHDVAESRCHDCHTATLAVSSDGCRTCHAAAAPAGAPLPEALHAHLLSHECVACHTEHRGPDGPLTREGVGHETGPGIGCVACHPPPEDELHAAGAEDCAACHQPDQWRPASFDHDRFFRFDRDHGPGCAECHPASFDAYDCYGCHAHSQRSVRGEHLEEGIREFGDCVECHRSGDEDEAERAWRQKDRPPTRRRHHEEHEDEGEEHDDRHDDD